jgi:purine-nucleoside phosphorylase
VTQPGDSIVPNERFRSWLATVQVAPRIAIIAGSGMAGIADGMDIVARAPMSELLDVTAATVAGHAGEVLVGRLSDAPCLCFLGRFHLYQGLSLWDTVAPVRALAQTSVKTLIVLNAAGGLNPDYAVGDIMMIDDHINLPGIAGLSPLIPPRTDAVTFVPMRHAYSPEVRNAFARAATRASITVRHGVYVMVAGPSYETDAELAMLRQFGADAVGMSTVPEVVMARAMGLDVAGFSVITNRAVPGEQTVPSHDEVLSASAGAIDRLGRLLGEFFAGVDGEKA